VYAVISTQAEKRKRVEMELIALRSQLNPHFIFNSLSSLQHFITTHQDELALDYLSRFAVLIRMILNNTRYLYIPLSDEIDFLELYTYLENIRFDKKIHFSVSWDKSLEIAKIKMPPMLVQPLIENAIKHGLLATRSNAKVEVHFFAKNDMLICLVRDNGIGLSKAEANKKLGTIEHHSISTNIIRERLEKLGSEKHASLEIREEKDENGNVLGTLAILSIPFSDKFIVKNPEQ
jgi:sensor histidine kinase YesM